MATEYIEKQAVMDKFAEVVAPANNSDFARVPSWNDAVGIVEGFPPADVRPVVRGRWERPEGDSRFMCSVCKGKEHVPTIMGEPTVWDYCPNCGADMRGGDAEDGR